MASPWKNLFQSWPEAIPRRGVVTNILDEAMPFKGFMVNDHFLLLERTNPDTLGSRFIILAYETISAVKLIDPLKAEIFMPLGFTGKFTM